MKISNPFGRVVGRQVGAGLVLVTAFALMLGLAAQVVLLPIAHPAQFSATQLSRFPSPLHVEGPSIVNAAGQQVRLKGLMVVDPVKLDAEGRFNRRFFAQVAATGANVVRIPAHPQYWQADPDYLWRYLDPAVRWAGELGMYAIIDWHSIGNVETGYAPTLPELYSHTKAMTAGFWTRIATHFRTAPNVLFEIFNEPASITEQSWRVNAGELVTRIREQDARQIVIVGGLEYAHDLAWVARGAIPDQELVYAAHIYPVHAQGSWNTYFGDIAAHYPVLITEWGFMDENAAPALPYLHGSAADYGAPLMRYLDSHEIGWVACWYDDGWEPPMWTTGGAAYTHFGAFVIDQLPR